MSLLRQLVLRSEAASQSSKATKAKGGSGKHEIERRA